MNEASVFSTFLIVFREALEASLVVGIILTVLARLRETRYFPHVLTSSGVAVLVSIFIGVALMMLTKHARHEVQEAMEGFISIIACGVLTYMVFWMDTQSKRIKPEIESKMEQALDRKEIAVIMALPFLAVLREGAETVLFLMATASDSSLLLSFVGGFSGLALAVMITVAIFLGGRRIPLKPLFRASGFLLLLMAAGLLTTGIHEFQELGWLIEIKKNVWNFNPILNEKTGLGSFLKALFGYNGNPSLLEVIAYGLYFLGVFTLLIRRKPSEISEGSRLVSK